MMSMMMRMNDWRQCDVCARMTNRLHHGQAYGMDCSACDDCAHYDADAYDDPPAQYADADRLREDRDERRRLAAEDQ